jgi:hypothetical protein
MQMDQYLFAVMELSWTWLIAALPLVVTVGFLLIRRQTPLKAAFILYSSISTYGFIGCVLLVLLPFQLADVNLTAQLQRDGYEFLSTAVSSVASLMRWLTTAFVALAIIGFPVYIGLRKWPAVWTPWIRNMQNGV